MFFVSTRNSKVLCKFKDAVLDVMAEHQGGIFTPSFFSAMNYQQIADLARLPYKQLLTELLYNYCEQTIDKNTLSRLMDEAFCDFNKGFGDSTKPNEMLSVEEFEENTFIVNLTHGPSGCCKDYGCCLTASLVNYYAKLEGKKRSIIDISGGSSGVSIAWAIKNQDFLKGFVVLQISKNPSVKALISKAVAPNFGYAVVDADDNFINKMRYEICNNVSLRELANMTFINELNIACIFAYLPIFFKLYIKCNSKPFCVSIPSGNLSIAMAGYFAKKIGIPVKKIILATEKNNFFYEIQQSKVAINNLDMEDGCTSLHSSLPTNFERLLFYLYDSNQGSVKRAMQELEANGRYKINDNLLAKFNETFFVAQCDNQFTIRNNIYSMIREKEIYVEQHFAIAKMAVDIAEGAIASEIANVPMVVFNTLDYRRNVDFVNSALGYDMEHVNYPWTDTDVKAFQGTEINADVTQILRYVVDDLDGKAHFVENEKKAEEKK